MGAGRRIALAVTAIGALAAPVLTAVPADAATASRALTVVASAPVLTLPAKDGLRDATRVRIASATKGAVDLLAVRGKKVLPLAEGVDLKHASTDWGRTVKVSVRDLTAGPWVLRARRADDHAVRASARIRVGSGEPVHVRTAPLAKTVYPYRDRLLDALDVTVTATDETAQPVPIRGTVRLESAGTPRTRTMSAGRARIPVTGLPLGAGTLLTTATGPAGKPVQRRTPVTLAATGVGTMRLAPSSDTVQPVRDGLLDTVTLTTGGAAVAGAPVPVSGRLTITDSLGVPVKTWKVLDGAPQTFTWDGRVNGAVAAGSYTATLSLKGPEGLAKTRTRTILVSRDHLPYRVRDLFGVAVGNQQGLAVHAGTFYVATDVGGDSSRIDRYGPDGTPQAPLATLPIGHGAELSYSTTTNLLYAANGGGTTPTHVWAIDPATGAIVSDADLSALGPNGLVAVDDARGRLLVFTGTAAGGYRLTPVPFTAAGISSPGQGTPISITGMPQGMEVVGDELWVYTSLKGANHVQRYPLGVAALSGSTIFDLMYAGEGEGLATDAGLIYVGAHGPNRVGVLEPVADE